MNAVLQERERLSRELHDGVAQIVAQLLLRLDTIKGLVAAERPQEAEAELERLHGVTDEIYDDIGESITGLRTNVAERGLVRALQDYVDRFEEQHQIPVSLQTYDTADQPDSEPFGSPQDRLVESISPLIAFQLFRLIQEALTNVRKHSGAREATVTLISHGPDQLRVVITDDGQGFTPGSQRNGRIGSGHPPSTSPALSRVEGSGRGLGLTSMRERVEALGGTFQVNSQPGLGTQLTATIPISRVRREKGHATLATSTG